MKKKWFLALAMFVCCLVHGVSDEVFKYRFDNYEKISMKIDDSDFELVYYDEIAAEMICVKFDESELEKFKSVAFECKLIAKNGLTLVIYYKENGTFKKISEKLFACGKKVEVKYGDYDGVYVKGTLVVTPLAEKNLSKAAETKADKNRELNVWSYTDELQSMIDNYYRKDFPDTIIDYSLTPTDQFPYKLDPVLASGNGTPDIFSLEDSFVRKYVEMGDEYLLDLTDVYNEVKDKLVKYPVEVGTYNGKVYAMSWQTCPGAMFYRRSLAKKYLGTDDPEEVQKYFSDWNKFLNTALILNEKSDGKCVAVSTTGDLFKPVLASRKQPWIVNGKLNIDPAMINYMKMCKVMKDKGLEGHQDPWAEGWFAGMKGDLRDEYGSRVEVFSYFMPTWGLHYVLKPWAPLTSGDWAMIQGPSAWSWGGTWIAAYKNTKNPKLAKDFIKYICSDDSFLERWAGDTGDLVSNNNAINKVKYNYSDVFLSSQNYYIPFAKSADKVDGSLSQSTDQAIESIFSEEVYAYMNNEKSLDQALSDFRNQVNMRLGF